MAVGITEIVTADYILVSPYTAHGYGVFDEVKDKFRDPNDRFESVPVKLKALVGRSRDDDQVPGSSIWASSIHGWPPAPYGSSGGTSSVASVRFPPGILSQTRAV